jgi:hypothetical protein
LSRGGKISGIGSGFEQDKTPRSISKGNFTDYQPDAKSDEIYLTFDEFCVIDFNLQGNE